VINEEEKRIIIDFISENEIEIINDKDLYSDDLFESYESYRLNRKKTLPKSLTRSEVNKKFIELKNTNEPKIREEIILGTMFLVTYYAWYYSKKFMIDIEEIEQYGYEGLVNAVNRFDLSKEKDFYIYAVIYIKGYIKRGIQEVSTGCVSLSLFRNIIDAKKKFEQEKGVEIEEDRNLIEKFVDYMIQSGFINKKYRHYYIQAINLVYNNDSLEQLTEDGCDIVSNRSTDDEYDLNFERERFMTLLKKLTPQQYEIINLIFGYNGLGNYTLKEISIMRNVSRANIHYYKKAGIKQILRSSLASRFKEMYDSSVFDDIQDDNYMETHQLIKK